MKPGGILAGSNYLDGDFPMGRFEGKTAIDTWAKPQSLEVNRSGEAVWANWIITIPRRWVRAVGRPIQKGLNAACARQALGRAPYWDSLP